MTLVRVSSNGDYWTLWWRDSAGRRRRKGLGPKSKITKRQAEIAARSLERDMLSNTAIRDRSGSVRLSSWIRDYTSMREGEIKPHTHDSEGAVMRRILKEWGVDARLERISPADVDDWIRSMRSEGLSGVTIHSHVQTARTCMERAKTRGLVISNPFDMVRVKRPRKTPPSLVIEDDELDRLIDAAPSDDWKRFIAILGYAGLRRGEALRLRWKHVDGERGRLRVEPEDGVVTVKARLRYPRIERRLWPWLAVGGEMNDPVVSVGDNNLHRKMRKIMKTAGLDWPKPYQTLRSSRAIIWRRNIPEGYVNQMMGHVQAVAESHYAGVPDDCYENLHQSCHNSDRR